MGKICRSIRHQNDHGVNLFGGSSSAVAEQANHALKAVRGTMPIAVSLLSLYARQADGVAEEARYAEQSETIRAARAGGAAGEQHTA